MTLLRLCTFAVIGLLAVSACSRNAEVPRLMNTSSSQNGPDEFSILPTQPLQAPADFNTLPTPTPGGSNLTDPDPRAAAVAALGGRVTAERSTGVPSADAGLVAYAGRQGVTPDIRATLAAEDEEIRRGGGGRILERMFNTNMYRRAYADQILDPQAELQVWRSRGVITPGAPPPGR
ncbi:DUF3035 domain-containing protein [Pararhodobacter zhoushanensis]|uniref:DUF3035 domain-containing protein n=1 Tax=Pararhodobacter zhoushanensis TaxID=2479545 RepID=UPI000F8E4CA8|nr:DUF3035 domain-containing protein [Pararhodobacter zhoushanensis]